MGNALRAVVATAILGLTLVPSAFAGTATTDFVLARDACGGTAAAPPNERLDLAPGASTDPCGSFDSWAGPSTTSFPAAAGVPITLDGTRHALIVITVDSYTGSPLGGVGDQTTAISLTGRNLANKRVTIASGTQTIPAASMLRTGTYAAEFDVPVVGGDYKTLQLDLTVGGAVLHGFVHYNGDSFLTLPTA
jgi:hypothetical protein